MINRITSKMMVASSQRNLQLSLSDLSKLQLQASGQKLITKPSDDPAALASSLYVRSQQRANDQYSSNVDDGTAWLNASDGALASVNSILQKVRDLTVQGANSGALDATGREAIATEIDSLKGELMSAANTTYLGRTIFAGNSDAGVAFNADYSYNGTAGSTVDRRISATTTVSVDSDGSAVFGTGTSSVFALLDNISTDLRAGTDVNARIAQVDTSLDAVTNQRSIVGAKYNQLQTGKATLLDQAASLEATRTSIEDVDLSKVVIDLKTQETTYQSALAITARALQPSLMSFLS